LTAFIKTYPPLYRSSALYAHDSKVPLRAVLSRVRFGPVLGSSNSAASRPALLEGLDLRRV
jgi:hypothetical protein